MQYNEGWPMSALFVYLFSAFFVYLFLPSLFTCFPTIFALNQNRLKSNKT